MMEVEHSPESLENLQRVAEFMEVKNPYAARRITINLQKGVSRQKQFREIGLPVIKVTAPESIRDLFVDGYTVRHLIAEGTINILRVWHSKKTRKTYNKTTDSLSSSRFVMFCLLHKRGQSPNLIT
jgi:plasmid stabilization system protein ParE